MIKAVIKNLLNVETHSGIFQTEQDALNWVEETKQTGAFGRYNRWYHASELTDEEKATAIETIVLDGVITNYRLPDDFTVTLIDISLQVLKEERALKGKKNQDFGASVIAQVYGINQAKILDGTFDNTTLQALLTNATLAQVERFLFNGSIETAKALIQTLDNTFYTNDEKAFIIGLIDEYLGA